MSMSVSAWRGRFRFPRLWPSTISIGGVVDKATVATKRAGATMVGTVATALPVWILLFREHVFTYQTSSTLVRICAGVLGVASFIALVAFGHRGHSTLKKIFVFASIFALAGGAYWFWTIQNLPVQQLQYVLSFVVGACGVVMALLWSIFMARFIGLGPSQPRLVTNPQEEPPVFYNDQE